MDLFGLLTVSFNPLANIDAVNTINEFNKSWPHRTFVVSVLDGRTERTITSQVGLNVSDMLYEREKVADAVKGL